MGLYCGVRSDNVVAKNQASAEVAIVGEMAVLEKIVFHEQETARPKIVRHRPCRVRFSIRAVSRGLDKEDIGLSCGVKKIVVENTINGVWVEGVIPIYGIVEVVVVDTNGSRRAVNINCPVGRGAGGWIECKARHPDRVSC